MQDRRVNGLVAQTLYLVTGCLRVIILSYTCIRVRPQSGDNDWLFLSHTPHTTVVLSPFSGPGKSGLPGIVGSKRDLEPLRPVPLPARSMAHLLAPPPPPACLPVFR